MQLPQTSLVTSTASVNTMALDAMHGNSIEEVAESLESVFASMLVKEMRKTLSDGLFGNEQSDIYGGMFDLHMGKAMTQGSGLGIRELVLSQLQTESLH